MSAPPLVLLRQWKVARTQHSLEIPFDRAEGPNIEDFVGYERKLLAQPRSRAIPGALVNDDDLIGNATFTRSRIAEILAISS